MIKDVENYAEPLKEYARSKKNNEFKFIDDGQTKMTFPTEVLTAVDGTCFYVLAWGIDYKLDRNYYIIYVPENGDLVDRFKYYDDYTYNYGTVKMVDNYDDELTIYGDNFYFYFMFAAKYAKKYNIVPLFLSLLSREQVEDIGWALNDMGDIDYD